MEIKTERANRKP